MQRAEASVEPGDERENVNGTSESEGAEPTVSVVGTYSAISSGTADGASHAPRRAASVYTGCVKVP